MIVGGFTIEVAIIASLAYAGWCNAQQRREGEQLLKRARAAWESRDFDGAIAAATAALSKVSDNESKARAYSWRGSARNDKGDLAAAIADFTASIRHERRANTFIMRSHVLDRNGDRQNALRDCEEAIRLDPAGYGGYYCRGSMRNKMGEPAKAIPDLNEAIHRDPSLSGPFVARARAYALLGDAQGAIASLESALRVAPNQKDLENLLANLRNPETQADYLGDSKFESP